MTAKSKKTPQTTFNGALIIDKPEGLTSHDVVARLRRILRTKKIGHTGTLDPFATGVLVMLIGKATRLARFLDKDAKTYEARLRFGFETETGDKEGTRRGTRDEGRGKEIRIQDSGVSEGNLPSRSELMSSVEAVLPEFRGSISQIPPMYSAKKIDGKKLYELARQGIEVERKPIEVNIFELEMIESDSDGASEVSLKVGCSAGTYIRTLAEDIGRRIGIGCHLSALRRTRAGGFGISDAITLEQLESIAESDKVVETLVSMNHSVSHLPEQILNENDLKLISHGMKIDARSTCDSVQNIRLTNEVDELVAIGETGPDGMIQPKLVLISD